MDDRRWSSVGPRLVFANFFCVFDGVFLSSIGQFTIRNRRAIVHAQIMIIILLFLTALMCSRLISGAHCSTANAEGYWPHIWV